MRAAMEEQMRHVAVGDVLLQTSVTLINLAARRLGLVGGGEDRDREQARLAIEGARALVPLLPPEEGDQLREPLSQLQMAYAREAGPAAHPVGGETGAPGPSPSASPASGAPSPPGAPGETAEDARRRADEEAERAKARSRIWTPRGA